jgi:hypothetical protein
MHEDVGLDLSYVGVSADDLRKCCFLYLVQLLQSEAGDWLIVFVIKPVLQQNKSNVIIVIN